MNKNVLLKVLSSGSTRFVTALGSIIFTTLIPVYFTLADLGEFTIAFSVVLGLALICRYGFAKYILRVTGANDSNQEATIKELSSVVLLVILVCIVMLLAINLLQGLFDFAFLETRSFTLLKYCILPLSVSPIFANYLNGIGKQEWAPLFEPAASSTGTANFFIFISLGYFVEFESVLICFTIISYLSFVFCLSYLGFKWVSGINFKTLRNTLTSNFDELNNYFLSGVSNYLLTMGIYPILGLSLNDEEVGFFRLCERIASFLNFILIIINSIFAPRYALHWGKNEKENTWKAYIESLKLGWLLCIPAAILIFIFADELMEHVFKIDLKFRESPLIFNFLLLGTFINVAFGGVLLLLDMTSHHSIAKNISLVMTVMGILCFYLLSRYFGLNGAAIAYFVFMLVFNCLGYYFAKKKIVNRQ